MNTLNKIWAASLLAAVLLFASPNRSKAQDNNSQDNNYVSDQEFYDDLQPYGTWINDPQYGNVWIPDVDEDFMPYASHGYWTLTDYGNTWVSDYPWGWATFHYGRWHFDKYYGWEWVPGHVWGPAWVSWRHGGGYYGWAPLLPGISIRVSIGGAYYVPDHYWVCAPEAYINSPDIYNYYVPSSRSGTIIHNTTVINNTYIKNKHTYITGPHQDEISQVTHRQVQINKIHKVTGPGNSNIQNNTLNLYKPSIHKSADAHPERVIDGAAYKQQHPNEAIAGKGAGGVPSFNHTNGANLAKVAKAKNPDKKLVSINPVNKRPDNSQPGNRPTQPAVTKQDQPGDNARKQLKPQNQQQDQPGDNARKQLKPQNQQQDQQQQKIQQQQAKQQQQARQLQQTQQYQQAQQQARQQQAQRRQPQQPPVQQQRPQQQKPHPQVQPKKD